MQFNSYIFLLAFLPLTLASYFLIGRKKPEYSRIVLLAASMVLYAYDGWKALLLICALALLNYGFLQRMHQNKVQLVIVIVLDVLVLGYFKYTNFLIDNINALTGASLYFSHSFVPLGISFIIFQMIAVSADCYKGIIKVDSLLDYFLYILYFPKISEGPLCDYKSLVRQFHEKERTCFQAEHFFEGICLFSIGLGKKTLLADRLSMPVTWGFSNVQYATAGDVFIVMICFALQLYFDFSGYCDMAEGVSRMLNIEIPVNFNSPYKAKNINDFWKRWHITLTDFLRRYIYFPLGGSRRGKARTYLNILIIFLISGFWHGAAWTYIAWGLLHGILCCLERMVDKGWKKVPSFLQWLVTFLLVCCLTMLLRADSIQQWLQMMKIMLRMYDLHLNADLAASFSGSALTSFYESYGFPVKNASLIFMILVLVISMSICLCFKNTSEIKFKVDGLTLASMVLLVFFSLLSFGNAAGFIYNGF